MPPALVRRLWSAARGVRLVDAVLTTARTLHVSQAALVRHLSNLDFITETEGDLLLEDIGAPGATRRERPR